MLYQRSLWTANEFSALSLLIIFINIPEEKNMKDKIIENLQSQLDELEMLQSMFPDPKVVHVHYDATRN